jgi:hypothetical protein
MITLLLTTTVLLTITALKSFAWQRARNAVAVAGTGAICS